MVEVAFTTDPNVAVPAYEDISADVVSASISRGRQRELDQVQAATLTLKINNSDRAYDPTYTFSPHYPYVLPMRKIRVSAIWSGVTYYLFTGYIERWPISWDAPKWMSVELTAVDGFALLAQAEIEGTFPVELTGSRISRVLSAAGWPDATPLPGAYWTLGTSTLDTSTILSFSVPASVVDTGNSVVQPVTLAAVSALEHIQEIVAAERGNAYIDGQGRFIFEDRHSRYNTTPLITFTDGSTSSTRVPYLNDGLAPEFDVDQIKNEIVVTSTGSSNAQRATDGFSIEQFWRHTLSLDLPLAGDLTGFGPGGEPLYAPADDAALDRAGFELSLRKDPRLEFTKLSVKPQALAITWSAILARELSDRVTVEADPDSPDPITPEQIIRDCFIESIAYSIVRGEWSATYQLSPADAYGQLFTLDTAMLGDAETAVLAY